MEKEKVAARNYRELIVWQDAIKIAKQVYELTGKFPKQETYALADQIRRAAVSVPSIIVKVRQENHLVISKDFYILHLVR